jgi:hypothetical protein
MDMHWNWSYGGEAVERYSLPQNSIIKGVCKRYRYFKYITLTISLKVNILDGFMQGKKTL